MLCKCSLPGNPDKTLIGCTTEPCKQWLHEDCIKHEALLATYRRLGTDKPHIAEHPVAKDDKAVDEAKRPLSPKETGVAVSTQQSIDVKQSVETPAAAATQANTGDSVDVKGAGEPSTTAASGSQTGGAAGTQPQSAVDKSALESPSVQGTPSKTGTPAKKGKGRKKAAGAVEPKPYQGLFSISLRMSTSPPVLEIKDLREGIVGGEKQWTEPIKCLVCGSQIN